MAKMYKDNKNKDLCKMTVGFEVYNELLSLVNVKTADDFINLTDDEIVKRLHTIKLSLKNHEDVIKQNRDLQKTIFNLKKYDIRKISAKTIDIYKTIDETLLYEIWEKILDELNRRKIKNNKEEGQKDDNKNTMD